MSTLEDPIANAIENEKTIRNSIKFVEQLLGTTASSSSPEHALMLHTLSTICHHRGRLNSKDAQEAVVQHLHSFRDRISATESESMVLTTGSLNQEKDDNTTDGETLVETAEAPPPQVRDVKEDGNQMMQAIKNHEWDKVLSLLQAGASPTTNVQNGQYISTPLHEISKAPASTSGGGSVHVLAVQTMVEMAKKSNSINVKDDQGNTPLHLCGKYGHYTMAACLLSSGASTEALNHNDETPLDSTQTALMSIQRPTQIFMDTMNLLLDGHAPSEHSDEQGDSAQQEEEKETEETEEMSENNKEKGNETKPVEEQRQTTKVTTLSNEERIEFETELHTFLSIERNYSKGLTRALALHQYDHAFMIARMISKEAHDQVVQHYLTHQRTLNTVGTTAVLVSPLTELYMNFHRDGLAMVTNGTNDDDGNRTNNDNHDSSCSTTLLNVDSVTLWVDTVVNLYLTNTPSSRERLLEMGDRTWVEWDKNKEEAAVYLAHTCYLLGEAALEGTGDISKRMILLGGDHRNEKNPMQYMSNINIQCTEVLDYARRVAMLEQVETGKEGAFGNTTAPFKAHDMSSFQLLYAMRLHAVGLTDCAALYLDALDATALNDIGKQRYDNLKNDVLFPSSSSLVSDSSVACNENGGGYNDQSFHEMQSSPPPMSTAPPHYNNNNNDNNSPFIIPGEEQSYPPMEPPPMMAAAHLNAHLIGHNHTNSNSSDNASQEIPPHSLHPYSYSDQNYSDQNYSDQHQYCSDQTAPPELMQPQQQMQPTQYDNGGHQYAGESGSAGLDEMMGGYSSTNSTVTLQPPSEEPRRTEISREQQQQPGQQQRQHQAEGEQSNRRGSFLSSAFTVLERVIHGSEDDGNGDINATGTGNFQTNTSSQAVDNGSTMESTEGNRRGSWLQGMFRSKNDKQKEANLGKSLEAYYDKNLGKWIFPGGGGEEEDSSDNSGNSGPPMMRSHGGGGGRNQPPPVMANNSGGGSGHLPPMAMNAGLSAGVARGYGGPTGHAPPVLSGSGRSRQKGVSQRYASFGLNVAAPAAESANEASHSIPSNLPPGPPGMNNNTSMIPGAF